MENTSLIKYNIENNNTLEQIEKDLENSDLLLFGSQDNMMQIMTRGASEKFQELKILNNSQIKEMAESINEINRATTSFGRTQSSYMDYLMTVSAYTPARNARQVLAEIERRRQALKENIFKQKKEVLNLKQKQEEFNNLLEEYLDLEEYVENLNPYDYKIDYFSDNENTQKEKNKIKSIKKRFDELKYIIPNLKIEIQELQANLSDGRLYVEGALKTIYKHQLVYKKIINKFNLENWDEVDFEKEEARYHVTTAFAQALEDVASRGGTIDKGDLIYMRQIGIHPVVATMELRKHLDRISQLVMSDVKMNITNDYCELMEEFLHEMADKYSDSCMKLLKSKGLDSWFDEESSFRDRNKKVNMDEKIRGKETKENSSKWNTKEDMTYEEFLSGYNDD